MLLKDKDETLVLAALSDMYGVLREEQRIAKIRGNAKREGEIGNHLAEIDNLIMRWVRETTT